METIVKFESKKTNVEVKLNDKVRIKKGFGEANVKGDWTDGEEFVVWKIEVTQWGTFVCPNNYQSCNIQRVEVVF